jgi:transcriptional regulator with XRE-family HTH domain
MITAIKVRRKELGMSQQELAKKAKMSDSFLSEVETGKRNIRNFDMLVRLVNALTNK